MIQHEFNIETSESETSVRILVAGELDLATAPLLDGEVRQVEATAASLVIDLSGVTFMDSSGLRLLVDAHQRSQENGNRLQIIEGSEPVRRVLRLSGLDQQLPIIQSADL